jgi:hypothetical protein
VRRVTTDFDRIYALVRALRRNLVTPVGLADTVRDWLRE